MEKENSFLDIFENLEDRRSTRNLLYSMSEILLSTLCAAICGAEGWQDVAGFWERTCWILAARSIGSVEAY